MKDQSSVTPIYDGVMAEHKRKIASGEPLPTRCEICNDEYEPYRKTQKYCSKKCRKVSRRKGESMYDILGGDGMNAIYGSEGTWYFPDGSSDDHGGV